jgi:hypothetical protein
VSESLPVTPAGTAPSRALRHWWRIVAESMPGLVVALLLLTAGVRVTGFGNYSSIVGVAFGVLIAWPLFITLRARKLARQAGMVLTGDPFPSTVERSAPLARMPNRFELEGAVHEAYRESTIDNVDENPKRVLGSGWLDRAAGYMKFDVVVRYSDDQVMATVHGGEGEHHGDGTAYFFVEKLIAALQWRCSTPLDPDG